MYKPIAFDLDRLKLTEVTYSGRKCYRLEEVHLKSAVRSVQIVDPENDFVLLRSETFYDNSTRNPSSRLREDVPFQVLSIDYREHQDTRIYIPVRITRQKYETIPLTENRKPKLTSEEITEFSEMSFQKPPSDKFALYDLRLSDVEQFRDNRKESDPKPHYVLPRSRNLLDPTDRPDLGDIPSDLAAEWFPPSTIP